MAADPYKYFRIEARELLEGLGQGVLALEQEPPTAELMAKLLRLAHTLKGAARVVKEVGIGEAAHAAEDVLAPLRAGGVAATREQVERLLALLDGMSARVSALGTPEPATAPTAASAFAPAPTPAPAAPGPAAAVPVEPIRSTGSDVAEMDALLDGLAEVSAQLGGLRGSLATVGRVHRLTELLAEQAASGAGRSSDKVAVLADELRQLSPRLERSLSGGLDRLERELRQVREGAERLRLVAASSVFVALERVARDAAVSLGKRVELDARGGEVRLDGHVLALVQRALVQLVRNAVAHGVEAEPARTAAGKPLAGRIHVEARRTGKRVAFICADDGAGIDLDAVRRKAGERGSAGVATASDAQLIDLLLAGGISTSATVTEAAGRGVGLDVAREIAARLGGVLSLTTTRGQGTRVELTVPVSMTSLDVLCVEAGGVTAAIPLDAIRHATRLAPSDVVRSAAGEAFRHEGEMLPFLPLAGRLGHRAAAAPVLRAAVVVQAISGRAAIGVEHLLGTVNVVLRPLPALAPTDALVAGASLDDLGDPQLVLDPDGLVEAARHAPVRAVVAEPARPPILVIDDSLTTRMLEQSILEAAGYRVDLASSAEEGLEKARQKDYGLFLVDVEMPGMDGFSFVQTTRADSELRKVPAILVTSRDAPEDRQRGADAGARGYVVKGEFEQTALLDTIKRLVRSA